MYPFIYFILKDLAVKDRKTKDLAVGCGAESTDLSRWQREKQGNNKNPAGLSAAAAKCAASGRDDKAVG
jgi:hypothetical protein